MFFSLGVGRFTASQLDATLHPRIRTPKPPVVYCHGTGAVVEARAGEPNATSTTSGVRAVLHAFVDAGYVVVAPTAPNLWGGTTGLARIADAITYAATLGATGDAILVGYSQGGMAALRYTMENPSAVACVIGLTGAVDLDYIRDNDSAGQRDDIDTIYGVTYPAALPAGVNPADNTGAFTGIPVQWWYASDDALVGATETTTFGAAVSADLHNVGALGHTDTALLAVDPAAVVAFAAANT